MRGDGRFPHHPTPTLHQAHAPEYARVQAAMNASDSSRNDRQAPIARLLPRRLRRGLEAVPNEAQERKHPANDEVRHVVRVFGSRFGEEVDRAHAIEHTDDQKGNRQEQGQSCHVSTPMRVRMKQPAPASRQYQPNGRRSFDRKYRVRNATEMYAAIAATMPPIAA